MKTATYQQTLARICLAVDVPAVDVEALGGDPARWRLYRQMVRSRLERAASDGLPRTATALNERGAFADVFAEFLAAHPPASRYIRDIILELDDYIQAHHPDAFVRDLSSYERHKWAVRDMPGHVPTDAGDFDFDAVPVMNPVALDFTVSHAVWKPSATAASRLAAPHSVVACRLLDDRVATAVVPADFVPVIHAWRTTELSATASVQALGEAGLIEVTPAYVGALCEHLATWMGRGLVLGSRV